MVYERFTSAERVADAVLYEGALLYPLRRPRTPAPSSALRWRFGIVAPRSVRGVSPYPTASQTECLIEPGTRPALTVRVRFLHLRQRRIETVRGESVGSLPTSRGLVSADDTALARTMDIGPIRLDGPRTTRVDVPIGTSGRQDVEWLTDEDGRLEGRVIDTLWPLLACLRIEVQTIATALKVRIRLENLADGLEPGGRMPLLRRALVNAHLLLGIDDGAFVSLLRTPAHMAGAAALCQNIGTWPVLVGPGDACSEMLSSPVRLYDYPDRGGDGQDGCQDGETELDRIIGFVRQPLRPSFFHPDPRTAEARREP